MGPGMRERMQCLLAAIFSNNPAELLRLWSNAVRNLCEAKLSITLCATFCLHSLTRCMRTHIDMRSTTPEIIVRLSCTFTLRRPLQADAHVLAGDGRGVPMLVHQLQGSSAQQQARGRLRAVCDGQALAARV